MIIFLNHPETLAVFGAEAEVESNFNQLLWALKPVKARPGFDHCIFIKKNMLIAAGDRSFRV